MSRYLCFICVVFLLYFLLVDRDIPSQKLIALQKVLESEFFTAVREVYEHVYETVDIQGDPEIRANATAKVRSIPQCTGAFPGTET